MKDCLKFIVHSLILGLFFQCSGTSTIQLAGQTYTNPKTLFLQTDGTANRLFFRKSEDGGVNWDSIVELEGPGSGSTDAIDLGKMALDTGNGVHIIFRQADSSGTKRVFYTRSTDGGNSFSTPVALDVNISQTPGLLRIATDSLGGVHVLWIKSVSGYYLLQYTFSSDNGVSFSTPVNIDANTDASAGDDVTDIDMSLSPAGVPHILFNQEVAAAPKIWYTSSPTRSPQGFSSPVQVDDLAAVSYTTPRIFVSDESTVHILFYRTNAVRSLRYRRSSNAGSSWASSVQLLSGTSISGMHLAADDSGTVHATYFVTIGTAFSYNRSTDGINFTAYSSGSGGLAFDHMAYAISDSNNPIIIDAEDTGGTNEMRIYISTDNGANYQNPIDIGSNLDPRAIAIETASNDDIHVAYLSSTNQCIFIRSVNLGSTFSSPIRIDNTSLGGCSDYQIRTRVKRSFSPL